MQRCEKGRLPAKRRTDLLKEAGIRRPRLTHQDGTSQSHRQRSQEGTKRSKFGTFLNRCRIAQTPSRRAVLYARCHLELALWWRRRWQRSKAMTLRNPSWPTQQPGPVLDATSCHEVQLRLAQAALRRFPGWEVTGWIRYGRTRTGC